MSSTNPSADSLVIASVRQWQTRLLQLDRRNALLYFAPNRKGVILQGVVPSALWKRVCEAKGDLSFPMPEPSEGEGPPLSGPGGSVRRAAGGIVPGELVTLPPPPELNKRLRSFFNKARQWEEEQGVHVLYLVLGLLHWIDAEEVPAISPLLLAPCSLTRRSPRDPYVLKADDDADPIVNPTLVHVLRKQAGIELPELGELSIDDHLQEVARLIRGRPGWRVEPACVLAPLSFAKLALWGDLERMIQDRVQHPLVRRLAGDTSAALPEAQYRGDLAKLSDERSLRGGGMDDLIAIHDQYTVVDADFSQLRAIEQARAGAHLVIHGPPGTGKSQTIANIIATLLGEGRRVLFVSEKTAALDVVKRRLVEVGLGPYCLDMHSDRGKKVSIYEQLEESLRAVPHREVPFDDEALRAQRDRLNQVCRALHKIRSPLGLSVFAVNGRAAALPAAPVPPIKPRLGGDLTAQELRALEEELDVLAVRAAEFKTHDTSPWIALSAGEATPGLGDELRRELRRLSEALRRFSDQVAAVAADYGLSKPRSLNAATVLLRLLDLLRQAPCATPEGWLTHAGLEGVRTAIAELETDLAERAALHDSLARRLTGARIPRDIDKWVAVLDAVLAEASRWRALTDGPWSAAVLPEPARTAGQWERCALRAEGLVPVVAEFVRVLPFPPGPPTLGAVEAAKELARRALSIGPVPASTFEPGAIRLARAQVETDRELTRQIAAEEAALFKDFAPELLDSVDAALLTRYRSDHRSVWRWLSSAWWQDRRVLQGHQRTSSPLAVEESIQIIERALNLQELRRRLEESRAALQTWFGPLLPGESPPWDEVLTRLGGIDELLNEHPSGTPHFRSLLSDTEALGRLRVLVSESEQGVLSPTNGPTLSARATAMSLSGLANEAAAFAGAQHQLAEILSALGPWSVLPAHVDELAVVLREVKALGSLEERFEGKQAQRQAELGEMYRGWATDLDGMLAAVEWVESIFKLFGRTLPSKLAARLMAPPTPEVIDRQREVISQALTQIRAVLGEVSGSYDATRTPFDSWERGRIDEIMEWSHRLEAVADDAGAWRQYQMTCDRLDGRLGAGFVAGLRQVTDDARLAGQIALRLVYRSWLDAWYSRDEALRCSQGDLEPVLKDFRRLDRQLPRAATARVRARCHQSYPVLEGLRSEYGELGQLNKQLAKKKRRLPIRQLIETIPHLLLRLKPCFMMSPLAVGQYLPMGKAPEDTLSFDTVIFDEASQVFPEDAISAVARGKQAIVVGDQQQLPPSSFFLRQDDDSDEEPDEDVSPEQEHALKDMQSILDVMIGMRGAGVAEAHLKVHYRSRHDSLIRYSNHYFYNDRLLTFPTTSARCTGLGLRAIHVPLGRYEAGGSRQNRIEAEQVVEEVFGLLERQPPSESIGVVALSRAQADLIETLIDARRIADRRFESRFAADAPERLFVKNLENVQGDERDHVVLSIGYGPTPATSLVHNRFGPINADGGHRRLNVAVTRARQSMTVVHSLQPSDIRSEVEGARLLRRYLEFARDGERAIEGERDTASGGEHESPFEEAVAQALRARGYRVRAQIGCAGFSIDLAIASEEGEDLDLGIECDGATYHSAPTARDRDRLRQEILERLGWRGRLHRIWSTDWLRNPAREMERLEAALRAARALPRESLWRADAERETSVGPVPRPPSSPSPTTRLAASVARPVTDFMTYEEVDLSEVVRYRDLDEERPENIAALVLLVVKAEGPVHVELVIDRVRRHYGIGRAGRIVQAAIEAGVELAIRQGQVVRLVEEPANGAASPFLIEAGAQCEHPRRPPSEGKPRKIEHISAQELVLALERVLRSIGGAQPEELVEITARELGFNRTGDVIKRRLDALLARLIAIGKVDRDLGSLVWRG